MTVSQTAQEEVQVQRLGAPPAFHFYSCDLFVEPAHRLGNIRMPHLLDLVDSPQQRQFGLHWAEARA